MLNEEWKQEYIADMGRQNPSAQSIERLKGINMAKSKNEPEPQEQEYEEKQPKKSKTGFIALVAACLVIVAAVPFAMNYLNKEPATPNKLKDAPAETAQVSSVMSYDGIYDIVSKLARNDVYTYMTGGTMKAAAPAAGAGAANGTGTVMDVTAESSRVSNDYSDTNVQTEGVQEADIVKTDGEYIYYLSDSRIYIVSAVDGRMANVSSIACGDYGDYGQQEGDAFEMYVSGSRLIVLKNLYEYSTEDTVTGYAEKKYFLPPRYTKTRTGVEVYDISNKFAPSYLTSISQSGSYVSSRMIGDFVYLITDEGLYKMSKDDPSTYIPSVEQDKKTTLISADNIRVSADTENGYPASYLVVSGIDTAAGAFKSVKSVLGSRSEVYSSLNNLYVTSFARVKDTGGYNDGTRIMRFSLSNGVLEFQSEGTVKGSLLNQFSMDEYNDTLRVVTTVSSVGKKGEDGIISESYMYNCLYMLNLKLETVGKLEKLASGERIYSVRFDGKTGYFVTFRRVDPLFTVDLSNPMDPKILSELKIPGFSEYLHPYGDGLLFGIGRNADETTGKAGFLKLSMFNTSDPTNVTEANKLTVDGVHFSEACSNHKAILINQEKNLIAFPADGKYYIYSYSSASGFTQKAIVSESKYLNDEPYYYYRNLRGLFIGSYLYVLHDGGISSFSMKDYSEYSTLSF